MATISGNPFEKGELKALLDDLMAPITSNLQFRRWKRSFLEGYEKILDVECVAAAEVTYSDFADSVAKLLALVTELQEFIDKGDLSEERRTVKASKCLNEANRLLEEVIVKTGELMPGTMEKEREVGYNKFHMGALLVRDGFAEYSHLAACADILEHMKTVTLVAVADKQIIEHMDGYRLRVDIFCDVMADLGLYDAMLVCNDLNKLPYEETPPPTPTPTPPPSPPPSPKPKKTKKKKKKKEKEEPYTPMTFTLSFPAPKPPTSSFIKLVENKDLKKKKEGTTAKGGVDGSDHSENMSKLKISDGKEGDEDDKDGSITGMQWDFTGSTTNLNIEVSPSSPKKKAVTMKKKNKKKAPLVRQDSCSSASASASASSASSEGSH